MDGRTYSTYGPKCPYCDFQHTPDEPFYYDEDNSVLECGECERKSEMRVFHQVSWTCIAQEPRP